MFKRKRDSLISVFCQCSMRTAFTGNMAEEVFNVVIVNRRFVIFFFKVSVQAPFRQRYRFKSTGLPPVSEKTQTIPIPNSHTTASWTWAALLQPADYKQAKSFKSLPSYFNHMLKLFFPQLSLCSHILGHSKTAVFEQTGHNLLTQHLFFTSIINLLWSESGSSLPFCRVTQVVSAALKWTEEQFWSVYQKLRTVL